MPVRARTNFRTLVVGTRLNIMEDRQVSPQPPLSLQQGIGLEFGRPNGPFKVHGNVASLAGAAVVVALSNGAEFEMSPLRADETGSGIENKGMLSEEWVIRHWLAGDPEVPI